MSVITSPYEFKILYYRLDLARISWNYFSEDQKETIKQQMRIAWEFNKERTMAIFASKTERMILQDEIKSLSENYN